MNAKEAADQIRAAFHLEVEKIPPETQHHINFLKAVATELGVDHTPFNLHQVETALADANIHRDSNEYPKMLFSRQHPANGIAGTYDARHDHVWTVVADEDQEDAIGDGWVPDPSKLPPRGDIPLYPAKAVDAPAADSALPINPPPPSAAVVEPVPAAPTDLAPVPPVAPAAAAGRPI